MPWVVTEHFAYETGRFDSLWSTEEKANARAKAIEKISPRPDWTEVIEAVIDELDNQTAYGLLSGGQRSRV